VFIILHESEFLSLSLEGRSPSGVSYADEREDVKEREKNWDYEITGYTVFCTDGSVSK
jgi:hypothetical protein